MRKNCSNDGEKLLKFKVEGREFAKILRSLEYIICSNSERSTEFFFKLFLEVSQNSDMYNKLEQLEFKLEKIIEIQRNMQDKLEKCFLTE